MLCLCCCFLLLLLEVGGGALLEGRFRLMLYPFFPSFFPSIPVPHFPPHAPCVTYQTLYCLSNSYVKLKQTIECPRSGKSYIP
uniref:Putative secreted protein n=1 Tax=Anopheles darlingi TaxID=43151 RepID=A0A2M4D527_ANODA